MHTHAGRAIFGHEPRIVGFLALDVILEDEVLPFSEESGSIGKVNSP